ncbi:hypothetical protein [Dethiosulfatarculus sandiegensis]|uniref:Uncharacterized protein n=1 Tax=Dethiosulfatarculus sandiegensis TaxID=1429043 RepID=A0A0D2JBC9_9BACT|nr:hypothetical protein [Dethiosulfatarculus sandiegensis]KIX13006.1 hypothetical protein X474_16325 [Dethiosulfatarculus sandiegensis]
MIFAGRNFEKPIISFFIVGLISCVMAGAIALQAKTAMAANEKPVPKEKNRLILSDIKIKVTSKGRTATFQL